MVCVIAPRFFLCGVFTIVQKFVYAPVENHTIIFFFNHTISCFAMFHRNIVHCGDRGLCKQGETSEIPELVLDVLLATHSGGRKEEGQNWGNLLLPNQL